MKLIINHRIKNQCLQTELNFPNGNKFPGNGAKNFVRALYNPELYRKVYRVVKLIIKR